MNLLRPKKRTLADAERDIQRLLAKIAVVEQEREFWSEQARALQNHLQTVMRGQAAMLDQMARTSMTADDVQQCVAQVSAELRQPCSIAHTAHEACKLHRGYGVHAAVRGRTGRTRPPIRVPTLQWPVSGGRNLR